MTSEEKRILNSVKQMPHIGESPLIIPNHSGDHQAGRMLRTPSNDTDLANKSYVDTQIIANSSIFPCNDEDQYSYVGNVYSYNSGTTGEVRGRAFDAVNDDHFSNTFIANSRAVGKRLSVRLIYNNADANAGNIVWQVYYYIGKVGEAYNTHASDSGSLVTASGSTANLQQQTLYTIPITLEDGDVCIINLHRRADVGADTYNGTVYLDAMYFVLVDP